MVFHQKDSPIHLYRTQNGFARRLVKGARLQARQAETVTSHKIGRSQSLTQIQNSPGHRPPFMVHSGGQGGTGSDLKRRGPGHQRGQKMAGRLSLLDRPLEVTPERKVLLPCDGRSQGNSGLQTGNGLPRMLLESPGNPGIRQKEGAQIASSRSGPVSIQCRRQQFLEKLALKPGFPGSIQVLHESIGIIPGTKFRMKVGRPYR